MGGFSAHSGKRENLKKRVLSEINVTPFVDVMLVLLIIFMVASPMMITGVGVDLPTTSASPIPGSDEPLVISIDKNKKIYIFDSLVEEKDLLPKLHFIAKLKKETRIFIRGDKGVEYGSIMHVMGILHAAGFHKVSLITETISQHSSS